MVLAIALLIFGPKKLPELGSGLGKGIRGFKDAIRGVANASENSVADERSNDVK
jgi:sec-independent protein translocase protein TatA